MSILRPYRFRSNYWSCSKVADWFRYFFTDGAITQPEAATLEEWDEWKKNYSTSFPKTYWLIEEFLGDLQDVIFYPFDVFNGIKYYIKNRFIRKTHIVYTGVKKGDYRDHDTRMLNAIMNILVDFVENDSSIEMLTWETSLRYNEDWGVNPGDEKYDTFTEQALAAQTFLQVYNWWKVLRPARLDPYDRPYEKGDWKEIATIEEAYHQEDNLMIETLLKYRHRLWT